MKPPIAVLSLFLIFILMTPPSAEAQRDSLRMEKEIIINAEGDTILVQEISPMHLSVSTPMQGRRVIIRSDGDRIRGTGRSSRQVLNRIPLEKMPHHDEVIEEVIVNEDGDTTMVTRRLLDEIQDIIVLGNRTYSHHSEEVIISMEGDTMVVTKRPDRRGDRERGNVFIEREIVSSDGNRARRKLRERVRRFRSRDQARSHQRSSMRQRMRVYDVRGEERNARELRQMELEARRLARQLGQADEEAYREVEEMLKAQLEKIFEHKQSMMRRELDQKRRDLEEDGKVLEQRQGNRETIINDRMNELLGRKSMYGW